MNNHYQHVKIEKIIEHSEDLRSFVLDVDLDSRPGQFVMVWLPGVDEKPFSLSAPNRITVKKVGPFTSALFEKKGELDIRGPYGKRFPINSGNTYIGGGVGIAPLVYAMSRDGDPRFVLAGKTRSDLIFLDDILGAVKGEGKVVTVTEDGSHGIQGLATDVDIPTARSRYVICGPEIMMKKVAEKLVADGVQEKNIFLSLERYMKCAVGICGTCSFSGYRVCTDGPAFSYDRVSSLPHFNEIHRSRTGELTKLD